MKIIDSDHYATSGIETFFFPGGEPHARIPKDFGDALLFLKARTWNDFGLGLVVLDALMQQSFQHGAEVWCFAAYLPGARQDRTDGQTPVTKNLYLNQLFDHSDRLFTFDAHSDLSDGLYRNFTVADLYVAERDGREWTAPANGHIIVPDAGAALRAQQLADAMGVKNPIIQCTKHRDFASGKFTGFTMPPLPGVGRYLIVDDICDGGGTFNLLAEEFQKDQYGKESNLALWVSHGIFSKGVDALNPKITEIATTDSWCQDFPAVRHRDSMNRLEVIPLKWIIEEILKEAEDV